MNKKERKEFSRLMQRQEKANRTRLERQKWINDQSSTVVMDNDEPIVNLAKTTKLVFFRQYNTYQALLEVYSTSSVGIDVIYAKVILYVMRWFRNRLGEDIFSDNSDIAFLQDQYPDPSEYVRFNIDEVSNINGFDFIDFETAFLKNKQAWVVRLVEPDNGQERKDLQGRTFTTEISVYKQEKSVVLGVRESCREPEQNTEDAFGYRPGFIRDIFYDEDLLITEQGIDTDYAFSKTAYKLNGKSAEACKFLYDKLIVAEGRQMPVLFVPGEYYEKYAEEVDKKTVSLLGYCHIVVLENGCRKLFEQTMENSELLEVAEEGQLIFYRTNNHQEYPSAFYEADSEEILEQIKKAAQNEPLRKYCDFKDYSFKPSWWEGAQEISDLKNAEIDEIKSQYESEIAHLRAKMNDLERDTDHLQRNFDALEAENKKLDKEIARNFSEISKSIKEMNDAIEERDRVKDELSKLKEESMREGMIAKGMVSEAKERYKPIINLPTLGRENKEEILDWIKEYYSDALVIHPNAEKSFFDDSRNIDWHRFCMMIHYLAGYTRERNNGGLALDPMAARDYDAEDSGYTIDPCGSGHGTFEMYKEKYTISIIENSENKNVLLDLHLKYGKGMDDNMIRIYFYYSSAERKSFIGFMPGHLPIR